MSFARRKLRVTIGIGRGTNGEGGQDFYTLPDGLRTRAHVENVGGYALSSAQVRIAGLTMDLMNKVSSLGLSIRRTRVNSLRLEAGDVGGGMVTVFQGTINEAWHDFGNAPETALSITAFMGLREQLLPVPPTSIRGPADAVTIMADLAGKIGFGFENAGVQGVILQNPYFSGTAREQIIKCAQAGGFDQVLENSVLIICPHGGSRNGVVPLISKDTGMVGYPSVGGQNNIRCRTEFHPGLAHLGRVKIQSVIGPANGVWQINILSHDLESETPGGSWFSEFEAGPLGVIRIA
ncbi:MAG: baseplate hub protein [Janthinobacterium lividum]